ncbi:hypothetical protein PQG76_10190, partial [Corynebacterium falsenii]|uniref:hypothetical protein n=1 Tax=Corynebacterium falsenii TaxID=108486 RepID=UPI00234CD612
MHISWKWFTDKFVGTPPDSDLDNVEENSGRYSLGFGAQNIGEVLLQLGAGAKKAPFLLCDQR